MTLDSLQMLLSWALPSGIGGLFGWLLSAAIRATRKKKEIEETYKILYESIQGTLLDLQEDNKKLYKAVGLLQRAIHKVNSCVHYHNCPVRGELQKQQDGGAKSKPNGTRQYRNKRNSGGDPRNGTRVESANSDSDGEPP